jgi:hypothetical protein
VLTLIGAIRKQSAGRAVHLVGTGGAGPWVLLARGLAGEAVDQTVVDLDGFSFSGVTSTSNPNFLPGALKYGGLGGLAALAAPAKLTIGGVEGADAGELKPLQVACDAAGGQLVIQEQRLTPEEITERLLTSASRE